MGKIRRILDSWIINLPEALSGEAKIVDINLPNQREAGDLLKIIAKGILGKELYPCLKAIRISEQGIERYFRIDPILEDQQIVVMETTTDFHIDLAQLENSVPINQVKSIISIYFSGPKCV
jgi:hypothetical protein